MNPIDSIVQIKCSAVRPSPECRRPICRRQGLCMPPRDPDYPPYFRCPHEPFERWERRTDLVQIVVRQLMLRYGGEFERALVADSMRPKKRKT